MSLKQCFISVRGLYAECKDRNFTSFADDEQWIYADGLQIGHHVISSPAITVIVPKVTKVIAVKILDHNHYGYLAGSFSDGNVTDSSWKCTEDYYDKWNFPTFDDSTWPAATASEGIVINSFLSKIANNARKIWAGTYFRKITSPLTVYCRKKLGMTN